MDSYFTRYFIGLKLNLPRILNWLFEFLKMRSSRINLEEIGVVAFNIYRREQNFSRMLRSIFLR